MSEKISYIETFDHIKYCLVINKINLNSLFYINSKRERKQQKI